MADIDLVKAALQGYVADVRDSTNTAITDASNCATQLVKRRKVSIMCKADGGTAGTAYTESNIFQPDVAVTIIAIKIAFPVAVTANGTNLATITVAKRDSAGANSATVAQNSTNTTDTVLGSNAVAFKPYSMTLTAANVSLAAGATLTLAIAKSASGVALAAATSDVNITIVYEESY